MLENIYYCHSCEIHQSKGIFTELTLNYVFHEFYVATILIRPALPENFASKIKSHNFQEN
jgi:hypothetical protein